MSDLGLSASVVIPSHGRTVWLERCLSGLLPHVTADDQVIVVLRRDDDASRKVVEAAWTIRDVLEVATVDHPGFWPALMAGVDRAEGDIVAFLDDDAIPMPGWLPAIRAGFADPTVGGFGGPILNFEGVRTANGFYDEGPVAWIDRLGVPRTRLHEWPSRRIVENVDFLPGSNMAYRRELLGPVQRMQLPLMAPGNELVIARSIRGQGYRVVFDSDVKVEHHPAPRPAMGREDRIAYAEAYAYSLDVALRDQPFLARSFQNLIGSRVAPGLLTGPLCLAKGRAARARWAAAQRGRRAARQDS